MSIIHILGESAVRSLALALAVALVLRVLRVEHAHLAKRAWTSVLILALAMPVLVALHIPSFSFLALWSTPRTVILPARPAVSAQNTFALDALHRSLRDNSAFTVIPKQPAFLAPSVTARVPVPAALEGRPQTASGRARHLALWQIGFAAYLAITTLLLLRVLLGLSLAVRLWRRAQPFATSETNLPVRLSLSLRSPATVGHGILLPLEAIGWDDAALRATLAHEEKHIREGDFYLQLAATLHHCFFWISPHAWWLRPQLSRLSETICDRAAIASSGDGLSYAQLLVRFATAERTPEGMLAMAQSAGLRERIERLITDPQLSSAFRHRRGQAVLAGVLLATVAIVAAASVHIIQPATIVLAAPQTPVPPPPPSASPAAAPQTPPAPNAAPAAAPAPAPPKAAPAPAPAPAAPDLVPPAAPPAPSADSDVNVGSGTGVGVGEGIGLDSSDRRVIQVHPEIHLKTHVVSRDGDKVLVVQGVGPVSPVMNVQALADVQAMATVRPMMILKDGMHVMALPQVEVNGPIDVHGGGYAIYGPDGDHTVMMHGWSGDSSAFRDERAKHPGGAILFERDGKTYVIDDPALVKQAEQAYSHVNELADKQGELGDRQGKLGDQQGELGELQGKLGELQGELGEKQAKFGEDFHFEMPQDFDKTVAELSEGEMKLALDGEKMTEQQRAALDAQMKETRERFDKEMEQFRAQQPQREELEKQMRDQTEQIRKQMEPLIQQMRDQAAKQAKLGALQGELGRQQAALGRQQREASREADSKVQSLIDQAVKDGKAKPVQ
jgi:hypothetical protein